VTGVQTCALPIFNSGTPPEALAQETLFRRLLRMGEEIPEGEWERFALLDRQIEARIARFKRGGLEAEVREPAAEAEVPAH
jgi:V/A-type H+-transporting ATPase subunit A